MTNLTINEARNRIVYGSKQYRLGSNTGFPLFLRYLQQVSGNFIVFTKNNSLLRFNGSRFVYENLTTGTVRTFTPAGRVGLFYLNKMKDSLNGEQSIRPIENRVD
jgi:hypothetical protein